MSLQNLSGVFLVSGFVIYYLAMFVAPRLYQEAAFDKRLEIIDAQKTRWILSQLMFALGMVLPGVGFLVLASTGPSVWLLYVGAGAFLVGCVLGAVLLYRQTVDPIGFWNRSATDPLSNGYFFLTLAGLLFIGVSFLLEDLPAWLAYLNIGIAIISAVVYLLRRGSGAFFLTLLLYLVTLVDGIMLLIADQLKL